MDKENPFFLIFGKKPDNYIFRLKDSEQIYNSFTCENPIEQVYVITGIRGSGKTVLLTAVTKEFEKKDDWVIVDLNSDKDLLEGMASELYQNSKLKNIFVKKEFNFSFKGISFSVEGENPVLTSESFIKKMLDKLKQKHKKVLITIDEVVSNEYMKVFAKTFQSLVRFDYPVFLLMTGLYENIFKLQNEKSLTFLYRAPKIYLGGLNLNAVAASYKKIFGIEAEKASKLAAITKGYAYGYQVLGYLLFKEGKNDVDDDVLFQFDQYMQEFVYDKLWSELSSAEKKIIRAINTNDAVSVKDIVSAVGEDNSYVGTYRDRLIKKGILHSPQYGKVRFSLPRFCEFVSAVTYWES